MTHLPRPESVTDSQYNRKALFIARENIRTLLQARNETQTLLARYCGHDKSWLNKFLNEGRGVQIGDLDKVAAFFGIEVYQLFQPGITRLTERRSQADRRLGHERRIGHTNRLISYLQTELNKVPHLAAPLSPGVPNASTLVAPSVPPAVQSILAEAEARIAAIYAGSHLPRGQDPSDRAVIAGAASRRRSVRHTHPDKAR
jgi:transcriptional regulator with XRE-family HTH domain